MTEANSIGHVDLEAIAGQVKQGRTVISAEDSIIIDLALRAIEEGKTATLYLKDALFTEIIRRRHSTPGAAPVNLEPVSSEEANRIKTDFNIEINGSSSRETCQRCGTIYGTYEFIQQGIKEHGEETVRAALTNASSRFIPGKTLFVKIAACHSRS